MNSHYTKGRQRYPYLPASLTTLAALAIANICFTPRAIAFSLVTATTPGTGVTPNELEVFLAPDDPLTFQIEVDPHQPVALDVFLLNDLTVSFQDDLPQVQAAIANLNSASPRAASDIQWGLGSFTDKAIFPFGGLMGRDTDGDGINDEVVTSADYPYRTDQVLTKDLSLLQAAADQLRTELGTDEPESQLEALLQVALRSKTELGFRDDAFKAVVLQTDAPFHFANDHYRVDANGEPLPLIALDEDGNFAVRDTLNPNNGDMVFDPWEDYPLVSQVRDALMEASIVPIFAVTEEVRSIYDELVSELGFGEVVTLNPDSSDLVSTIQEGLDQALKNVTLVAEGDDFDYVQQIASDTAATKGATDFDVPDGETAKFQVTLEDRSGDNLTGSDSFTLMALGYGSVAVHVNTEDTNRNPQKIPEPGMAIALLGVGAWLTFNRGRNRP